MTDKSTHDMHQCSDMEKDAPWTMDSTPIMGGPYPAAWEIWGPDGDRVALVHGNVALDVTAEERAERIVEAVQGEQGPNDKLNDIQAQLQDMQKRINNIEAHTKAVETATSNAAHRKCDRLAQELDNVRDKIRELHEYLEEELSISKAFKESFEPYALTKELHYWRGKTDECAKILDKFDFLFDE